VRGMVLSKGKGKTQLHRLAEDLTPMDHSSRRNS
jgi:hypothetical protein